MNVDILLYPNVGIIAGSLIIGIAILSGARAVKDELTSVISDAVHALQSGSQELQRQSDMMARLEAERIEPSNERAEVRMEQFITAENHKS